ECEQFARRIVDNMNDSPTRLIKMRSNDTMKLERVYSKPSVKYNRPIGVDEPQLPKDPIWSPSLYKIRRIVVRKNPPMPILYYLNESGPQRPFVREQLMHIKEEAMPPPRWVLKDSSVLVGEKKAQFGNVDYYYIQKPNLTLHCIHLDATFQEFRFSE
ncbi:9064_t:CDS:2, partial [Gigaspora margarita]